MMHFKQTLRLRGRMKRDDFKFIPLRGMSWDDLLKWVRQSSPKHFEFIDSVSGTLYSLFGGTLPHVQVSDKVVTFVWDERNRHFLLRMRVCPAHGSLVDLEWEIRDQDKNVISSGTSDASPWLPSELIGEFSFHWSVANELHMLVLQLGLAAFIVVAIFIGLVFVG